MQCECAGSVQWQWQGRAGGGHGSTVVGGGLFRCCVPWCGARAAADDADYALREGSPSLSHQEQGKTTFFYPNFYTNFNFEVGTC